MLHLYVHLMEMSPFPERALRHGDRLRRLVPDGGHLIHMPTHIDVLCGNYHDVVAWNRQATLADGRWLEREGYHNVYTLYRNHNHHFLIYGAMFLGQYSVAMAAAEELIALIPEDFLRIESPPFADAAEGFVAMKQHVLVRFGRWQEIIDQPLPDDRELYAATTAITLYAKAVAHSALGNIAGAEAAQARFLEAKEAVPESRRVHNNTVVDLLEVAEAMIEGELAYRKGRHDEAFDHLRRAVRIEDGLLYDEPWGWMQPTRHALGALLLEQGRHDEAEAVYRADLGLDDSVERSRQHPNNPWSLHGLLECLRQPGRDRRSGPRGPPARRRHGSIRGRDQGLVLLPPGGDGRYLIASQAVGGSAGGADAHEQDCCGATRRGRRGGTTMRRPPIRLALLLGAVALLLGGLAPPAAADGGGRRGQDRHQAVRFATFNASLNRTFAGELVDNLSEPYDGSDPSVSVEVLRRWQAANVAEVIQRVRPDVLVINEFDFDAVGAGIDLFRANYLEISQNGADPIDYPYAFVAESNTGLPSGVDLDNSGGVGGPGDAFGFGFYPGQFGMAVLSRYPIDLDAVRTFQTFLWKDMPGTCCRPTSTPTRPSRSSGCRRSPTGTSPSTCPAAGSTSWSATRRRRCSTGPRTATAGATTTRSASGPITSTPRAAGTSTTTPAAPAAWGPASGS